MCIELTGDSGSGSTFTGVLLERFVPTLFLQEAAVGSSREWISDFLGPFGASVGDSEELLTILIQPSDLMGDLDLTGLA